MSDVVTVPKDILNRFDAFRHASVKPFGTGLINKTFLVTHNGHSAVFQRLHPVFQPSVNIDIDAVTRHLAHKGLVTPRVLATDDGALFVLDDEAHPWRALTLVNGHSVDRVDSPKRAFAAGALVAQFHEAMRDFSHDYVHVRPGVHDTAKHAATLLQAKAEHPSHRLYGEVAPLADAILTGIAALPAFDRLPLWHVHGDLKISNLLFNDDQRGVCLVDLDTVGRMVWPHELGDALRSWTNPSGEDVTDTDVDVEIFRAAVQGYASVDCGVSSQEWALLVDGVIAISTELAARFLADALNERYFGFNAQKYPARGEHNLVRAKGQWSLAQAFARRRRELETIVAAARAS